MCLETITKQTGWLGFVSPRRASKGQTTKRQMQRSRSADRAGNAGKAARPSPDRAGYAGKAARLSTDRARICAGYARDMRVPYSGTLHNCWLWIVAGLSAVSRATPVSLFLFCYCVAEHILGHQNIYYFIPPKPYNFNHKRTEFLYFWYTSYSILGFLWKHYVFISKKLNVAANTFSST